MKLSKKDLFDRLFSYRRRSNLTQKEVADRLEISKLSLFNYEKGKYMPPFEIIEKLAEIYGTTSFQLLYGIEEPKQEEKEEKLAEVIEEPTEIIEEATPEKPEEPTEEENEDTEEIKHLKSAKLFAYLLKHPHKIDALIKLLEL